MKQLSPPRVPPQQPLSNISEREAKREVPLQRHVAPDHQRFLTSRHAHTHLTRCELRNVRYVGELCGNARGWGAADARHRCSIRSRLLPDEDASSSHLESLFPVGPACWHQQLGDICYFQLGRCSAEGASHRRAAARTDGHPCGWVAAWLMFPAAPPPPSAPR